MKNELQSNAHISYDDWYAEMHRQLRRKTELHLIEQLTPQCRSMMDLHRDYQEGRTPEEAADGLIDLQEQLEPGFFG